MSKRRGWKLVLAFSAVAGLLLVPGLTHTAGAEDQDAPATGPKVGHGAVQRTGKAFGEQSDRAGKRKQKMQEVMNELDLSDDQRQEVEQILADAAAANRAFRQTHSDELEAIKQRMKQAKENQDKEALKAAMKDLRELRQGADLSANATADKIRAVLTPEQQEKFDALIGEMKRRMAARAGGGGPWAQKLAALDLSDEQKEQVRAILQDAKPDEADKATFQQLRQEMKEARQNGDREKMKALRGQIWDHMKSRAGTREEVMTELQKVLTDEQWEQLQASLQDARKGKAKASSVRDRIRARGGARTGSGE